MMQVQVPFMERNLYAGDPIASIVGCEIVGRRIREKKKAE